MHNLPQALFKAPARARVCLLSLIVLAVMALSGCSSSSSKQEYAYVSVPEAVLRDRVGAAVYNKAGTVHNGERVIVLERMQNRRFVRVRSSGGEEGWIQERYLTDQKTFDQLQQMANQYKDTPAQAVAVAKKETNLHVLPGRKSEHLYQVAENQRVDVLRRQTVDRNAPAPSSQPKPDKADAEPSSEDEAPAKPGPAPVMEDWWLIRDSQKHIGWALGGMLYVDIPTDVATYAEGHRITAFFVLDQVQDGDKNVPEYLLLLTENHDGLPYDFDQVRVFTWNVRRHRYETAFLERGFSGFLPATLGKENFGREGDLRTFKLQVADSDGNLHDVKYKFNPPIVRQVLGPGEQPPPKVHHKAAKPKRHSR